jgi:transposase-like protein
MTAKTIIRGLREAEKAVRAMGGQGFVAAEDYRGACRNTAVQVLVGQMQARLSAHLERCSRQGPSDRRNGSYPRHLLTEVGDLSLQVPRSRRYAPVEVLRAYARRADSVNRMILACFVLGLSTRKVAKALLPVLGEAVSPATVSRIAKTLDGAVAAFHRRKLEDRYRMLVFDGVVLARKTGMGALRRPVLVVLGVLPDRRKEVIDFRQAPAESQAAWEAFLNDLYRRGLTGQNAELAVSDGGKGLLAALPLVYPQLPVQRCWAHKTRNLLDKCRKADWPLVKRNLHRISHAANRAQARQAAARFAQRWQALYPKAVACLRADLDELLAYYVFDDPDWRKAARTTNAIERRFREVRRRTRPMGVMADRTSIERILYAVFANENRTQGVPSIFPLTQNS